MIQNALYVGFLTTKRVSSQPTNTPEMRKVSPLLLWLAPPWKCAPKDTILQIGPSYHHDGSNVFSRIVTIPQLYRYIDISVLKHIIILPAFGGTRSCAELHSNNQYFPSRLHLSLIDHLHSETKWPRWRAMINAIIQKRKEKKKNPYWDCNGLHKTHWHIVKGS